MDLARIYLSHNIIIKRHSMIMANVAEDMSQQIEQFTNEMVKHWVMRGFDSDELIALGNRKSVEFLIQIAETSPHLDDAMFFVHM